MKRLDGLLPDLATGPKASESEIGTQPSTTGCEAVSATRTLISAEGLLTADTRQNTDRMLALLKRQLGSSLDMRETAIFDGGQFAGTRVIVDRCADLDKEQIRGCENLFEAFMRPANQKDLLQALSVLKVSTVMRDTNELDGELQLSVYVDGLMQFPADCAMAAVQKDRKWFPALMELKEDAGRLARSRIETVERIRRSYHG